MPEPVRELDGAGQPAVDGDVGGGAVVAAAAAEDVMRLAAAPSATCTRSTVGWPRVRVPVLSNTTARARPTCSIAAPVLTMTPRSAARLIPAMTAIGVARMRGQ